jgi:ATP-binding cassette subfamily C (CFTR/MRP) protein 1
LFDDPLSALDASVSAFLMERTMRELLRDKTRVIITHALQFLKYADNIILLEHGEVVFHGTYDNLRKGGHLQKYKMEEASDVSASEDENKPEKKKRVIKLEANEVRAVQNTEKLDPILSKFASEDRTKGNLSFNLIHRYIKNTGGYLLLFILVALTIIGAFGQIYAARYILNWSSQESADGPNRWRNFGIYCAILYGYCTLAVIRFIIHLVLGMGYSRRVHSTMIYRVFHAPVEEFIEKVSMGRLLNRFTKDLDVLDKAIVKQLPLFLTNLSLVLISCTFVILILDWVTSLPLILFVVYGFFLQRISMGVKREAVRLEAISKSPIVSWSGETIRGLPQIRSSKKSNYVTRIMVNLLHSNMVNSLLAIGLDAWFKTRVSLVNVIFVQVPIYLYTLFYKMDTITVSEIATLLLLSTCMSDDLLRMFTFFNDVEGSFISVERITYFEDVPHEKNYKNFDKDLQRLTYVDEKTPLRSFCKPSSEHIVSKGEVVFKQVTARYGSDSDPVLKGLDFTVRSGEKIGIVGRTGAGKSSLIKLFWLSLFPSEGHVTVDGTDITEVDLKTLRNEVMVVSQETALFQGSLAENIDPNMTEEDYPKAMEILNELGIKNKNILEKGMESKVDADGANFSQGEKQIICFARTLINQKKLIILDEATANIDIRTEQAIKKIQETKFADSTMFIIAHRLKTVMHCDRIMVLRFGQIVEFDSPANLLAMPNGLFRDMYEKMNEEE